MRRDTTLSNGPFVVQIHSAGNVPRMDITSDSDCYAMVWLETCDGEMKSERKRTWCVRDSNEPVWGYCYIPLRCSLSPTDILRLDLFDQDFASADDKIGSLEVNASSLPINGLIELPLKMKTSLRGAQKNNPAVVNLRAVPSTRQKFRKDIFIMRHGKSKWNQAKESGDVAGMAHFDHGLDKSGVEQCSAFHAKLSEAGLPAENAFKRADVIFSSPLTRAVQTAVLALRGHETFSSKGMVLCRNIREVKRTLVSFDTVGIETGAESILAHARKELDGMLDDASLDNIFAQCMDKVDSNDTLSDWWTPSTEREASESVDIRVHYVMEMLKYMPHDSAILVGHNIFFRRFLRTYLSEAFKNEEPLLAENALYGKLSHAACCKLTIEFDPDPLKDDRILRLEPLFGSTFIPPASATNSDIKYATSVSEMAASQSIAVDM